VQEIIIMYAGFTWLCIRPGAGFNVAHVMKNCFSNTEFNTKFYLCIFYINFIIFPRVEEELV
jgi:hypothetical protein